MHNFGHKSPYTNIIMRADAQPACKKARRVPYALKEQVENEWDELEKHGVPNCGDKRLITLLEFAETVRLLSISLNDEMMYEINHILISISLIKMSYTFHPQLRICVLHYLALRYDLSHAYDVNGTCFLTI